MYSVCKLTCIEGGINSFIKYWYFLPIILCAIDLGLLSFNYKEALVRMEHFSCGRVTFKLLNHKGQFHFVSTPSGQGGWI